MADGPLYNDIKTPITDADVAAVTLAATFKALYPVANFAPLPSSYFGQVGKKLKIRLFGRITTGATPGNLQLGVYLGSGADATGTQLAVSAAQALTASQSNLSFEVELVVTCRAKGATGALLVTGKAQFNEAVITPHLMIPASAPVQVTADLTTANNIISVQALRSGSTAEAIQIHDMEVIALN